MILSWRANWLWSHPLNRSINFVEIIIRVAVISETSDPRLGGTRPIEEVESSLVLIAIGGPVSIRETGTSIRP